MKVLQDFTRRFPLLIAVLAIVLCWCGVNYFPDLLPGYYARVLKEVVLVVASVIIAILFVRPMVFHRTTKGCGYAFKKSIYFIIVNIGVFSICVFIFGVIENASHIGIGNLVPAFFIALILSLGAGILEEITFRVFVFGGLLAKFGTSRVGILVVAIVSSILFGFMHVAPVFFNGAPLTTDVILQMFGKTLQSGALGILACALYLKTHNIWSIIVLHMLSDLFALWGSVFAGTFGASYASGMPEGTIIYVVLIVANIPVYISSIRMILGEPAPQLGPLADDNFLPRVPADVKKKKRTEAQAAGE